MVINNAIRFERLLPRISQTNARIIIDNSISHMEKITENVLAKLQDAVTRLKSRRNNEAPINTLPETVLRRIFGLVGNNGYAHQCITTISWTCAIWRDICLRTPSLWHAIDLSNISPRIADMFFIRSQMLPLSLMAIDRGPYTKQILRQKEYEDFCVKHIDSVRELHLALPMSLTWSSFRNLKPVLLEVLSLHFVQPANSWYWPKSSIVSGDGPAMEDILGECPRLWHLSLHGVLLPSTSTAYDHLRTLTVALPSIVPGSLDIYSILKRSSLLEVLSISIPMKVAAFDDGETGKGDLISLAHLRQLTLALPSIDISRILSNISTELPLRIVLKDTGSPDVNIPEILPSDPRCLPCVADAEKLCINRESWRIKMHRSSGPDGAIIEEEPFLDCSVLSPTCFALVPIVHLISSIQSIKELEFDDTSNQSETLDAKDLITLLRLMPDIMVLRLRSCRSDICALLAIHARHAKPPVCRSLRALYLEDMALNAEGLLSICMSLTPRIGSVLVSKCFFDEPKDTVTGILSTVTTVDLQVIDSKFDASQSTRKSMTLPMTMFGSANEQTWTLTFSADPGPSEHKEPIESTDLDGKDKFVFKDLKPSTITLESGSTFYPLRATRWNPGVITISGWNNEAESVAVSEVSNRVALTLDGFGRRKTEKGNKMHV